MARKHDHGFVAIRIEGGILPPEFLQKVAAYKAPRQTEDDYGLSKSLKLADEIGRAWRIAQAEWQEYRDRRQRAEVSQVLVGVSRWLTRLMSDVLGYRDLQPSAAAMVGRAAGFLLESMPVQIAFHDGVPLYLELPVTVELVVASTEPGLQGDRSSAGTKPATLETGAEIQVPLFLTTGEKIKVDTRDGRYLGRVNDK